MVRPSHPDRLRALLGTCEPTLGVYREYPNNNGECPGYASDVTQRCCTLNPRARDIAFLHIVKRVFENSPDDIFVDRPFPSEFINWVDALPILSSGADNDDHNTIGINDERFDMIRAFVLRMQPSGHFNLTVDVPLGHHVFRFTDNYAATTRYVGLGTGTSTLDVSDLGLKILENKDDTPFMYGSSSFSSFKIITENLVPVIHRSLTLPRFLAQVVDAVIRTRSPNSSAFVLFDEGNVERATIPNTHVSLNQFHQSPQEVAESLARLLVSQESLRDIMVQREEGTTLVKVTATNTHIRRGVERRVEDAQLEVEIWPLLSVSFLRSTVI